MANRAGWGEAIILFNSVCFNCRWRGLSDANLWNKTGINGPAPEILTGLRLSSVWLTDYCLVQRFFKWPQLPSSLLSFSVCSFLCLHVCVKVHALAPVWRSEDSLREWALPSAISILGFKLRSVRLGSKHLSKLSHAPGLVTLCILQHSMESERNAIAVDALVHWLPTKCKL